MTSSFRNKKPSAFGNLSKIGGNVLRVQGKKTVDLVI
jgi:hypothetical protein